jgi:small subunit ribosomal protein S2
LPIESLIFKTSAQQYFSMAAKLLIDREKYLASGIHIGMKQRTAQMKQFIYKLRSDGLAVLNLQKIDERIRIAAKFLARQKNILVVGRKTAAHAAIKKFGEVVGARVVTGRFVPGILTNPNYKNFFEADVIVLVDPLIDYQAMAEAVKARVPIVAIADTFNETKDIDLIIPANNKGQKSLAMLFYLLAREILKERKIIKSGSEFQYKLEDFSTEKY